MTHRERFLRVDQERQALASVIAALPQQITWAKGESKTLEDEVIRRELLGEDVPTQKKELEKKRDDIRRWEREFEDGKNKLRVMSEVLQDLRGKAEADMTPVAHKQFGKAVKDFVEKLQGARAAEVNMAALREEVKREFDEIGSRCPIETWETVIIRHLADANLKVVMGDFIDRMKSHGYDVS